MLQNDDAGDSEHDHTSIAPDEIKIQNSADDLLTIFSDRCTVKFVSTTGEVETKVGRWCLICK